MAENHHFFSKILSVFSSILSFCLVLSAIGCAGLAVNPAPTISNDQVGEAFTAVPSPTAFLPTSPENQIVIACSQPGIVRRFELHSAAMNEILPFSVYYPPCYGNGVQDVYPALYLLHGQTFDDTQWQRLGITLLADHLIQTGRTLPFLIIMPYEQFHYRPVKNNQFPVALLDELLPWVESNLHAKSERYWRAIGGISRGASWAVRLGLQHWDLFGAIGAHLSLIHI